MNERVRLGNRIKYLRNKKKISRGELSLLSTVNYTTLMNIENGRTNPKLDTLWRLAKFLEVNLKEFFNDGEK
ncbi:MAG: helix-turn-helix domain-containing protein [Firmicutes bacterium]|nr:helix-turn-helix domain-containing protein [Bacillota bacterium]